MRTQDSPAALCRGPCDWEQGLLPKASGLKPTMVEEAIAKMGPAALVNFSNDSSPTHNLSPSQDHLEVLIWRNGDNKCLLWTFYVRISIPRNQIINPLFIHTKYILLSSLWISFVLILSSFGTNDLQKHLNILLWMYRKWYDIFKHHIWIYQHIYLLWQAVQSKLVGKLSPASKPAELTVK